MNNHDAGTSGTAEATCQVPGWNESCSWELEAESQQASPAEVTILAFSLKNVTRRVFQILYGNRFSGVRTSMLHVVISPSSFVVNEIDGIPCVSLSVNDPLPSDTSKS